jgi:hypothetical protein
MSYFSTVQRHPSPAFCTSSIIPLPQSPRISIFAVSASLDQYSLEYLQAAGFDGSLPKPIDFARLGFLLQGMACVESRARGRYRVEDAKAGGWYN